MREFLMLIEMRMEVELQRNQLLDRGRNRREVEIHLWDHLRLNLI